ncbi:MAG: 16S rRNA (cytosine(967)-C(5))-methyltransferase RsmB [Solirubrobacteraceae bacterium]|nr:16S rRNA (cytosine(967)-C(5))-methyltransferase RsmB [Solirubrobacteraceae bacterium]
MSTVTPARRAAFAVVRRVFEQGAYADRALHGEAEGLDPRERALAMRLAFGTVQRRGSLDWIIAQLARPPGELDPSVVAALRLGLYQLLFMDGIADHAAVDTSVELAKQAGGGGGFKLVNAVLRRAQRETPELPSDATAAGAAVRHSYPRWLAERWFEELGPERARGLMAAGNKPAELAVRVNTLVGDRATIAAKLGVPWHEATDLPEGVIVEQGFDAHGHPLWAEGAFMPQSRAAMHVAHAVDPQPGEQILDLCAAPGGKTTHLAALMGDEGRVVAVERHAGRARALAQTAQRMRAGIVRVEVGEAETRPRTERFDRVLLDPPCSGLGTVQGHPDIRWRASPERTARMAEHQRALLRAAEALVKPGGRIVYSTCTLLRTENEDVVASSPLPLVAARTFAPDTDATDGFHVATLGA